MYLMFVFVISNFMKSCTFTLTVYAASLCTFVHRWPKRNLRVCTGKIEFET